MGIKDSYEKKRTSFNTQPTGERVKLEGMFCLMFTEIQRLSTFRIKDCDHVKNDVL